MHLKLPALVSGFSLLFLLFFLGLAAPSSVKADECAGTYRCYKYSSALNDCLQTTNSYSCSGSNYSSCLNSANRSTQPSCVKCGVKSSGCSWSYCGSLNQACCSWGCEGGLTCQGGVCKNPAPTCNAGDYNCTNNTLYQCNSSGSGWNYVTSCVYGCASSTACNVPYCINKDQCNQNCTTSMSTDGTSCGPNDPLCTKVWCWPSSTAYKSNPDSPTSKSCLDSSTCSQLCHPVQDTCQVPPSIDCNALGYPGMVAHIDNCGNVGCGPPCGGGGGGCSAGSPTNASVTRVSDTKGTINWIPGVNGASQQLFVGANKTEVNAGCPGTNLPACVVKEINLSIGQSSYTTGDVLSPNTVYYWRVVNYQSAACSTGVTLTNVSSCNASPSTITIMTGTNATLTSSVNASSDIQSVNFASGNTGIATVNPASDASYQYQTLVTSVAPGSTNVTSNVMIGGVSNCSATTPVSVTPPIAWWQVKDADITTNGDLVSSIPSSCSLPVCNPVLGLKGNGGFPGVPLFAGAADFQAGAGVGKAAEDPYNWQANSTYASGRTYNFNYFKGQIPPDVVFTEIDSGSVNGGFFNSGGTPSRGYIWYHFNGAALGDLTITGNINLVGDRKVVLLVEGANLNVNGLINLQNKGFGFFMAIVGKDATGFKGNIVIDPSVTHPNQPALEGIFLAEGQIRTGASANKLYLRGSFVAYDGFLLQRNLAVANANTPAELFEYSPSIMTTFPRVFTQRRMRWKEVAP